MPSTWSGTDGLVDSVARGAGIPTQVRPPSRVRTIEVHGGVPARRRGAEHPAVVGADERGRDRREAGRDRAAGGPDRRGRSGAGRRRRRAGRGATGRRRAGCGRDARGRDGGPDVGRSRGRTRCGVQGLVTHERRRDPRGHDPGRDSRQTQPAAPRRPGRSGVDGRISRERPVVRQLARRLRTERCAQQRFEFGVAVLELVVVAHRVPPREARRFAIARLADDFTVPADTPSTAAISASDRSDQ